MPDAGWIALMGGLVGLAGAALGWVGSWVIQKGQREHDSEVRKSEALQRLLDEPLEKVSSMIEAGAALVNILSRINSSIEGSITKDVLSERIEQYWETENRAVISLIKLDPEGVIGNHLVSFNRLLTATSIPVSAGKVVETSDLMSLQTALAEMIEGRDHIRKKSLNGLEQIQSGKKKEESRSSHSGSMAPSA